jgi:hypothetical protein
VTVDNRNVAGVTLGCDASSGAVVTNGIEWAIPLATIGNPTGCVKVTAIVDINQALFWYQAIGPLPPGTCGYSDVSTVNFASVAGDQFFTVCLGPTGVPILEVPEEGVSIAPNPLPIGAPLAVAFRAPQPGTITIDLFDVAGRRAATTSAQVVAGARTLVWSPRGIPAGAYRLVVRRGSETIGRRGLIVLR